MNHGATGSARPIPARATPYARRRIKALALALALSACGASSRDRPTPPHAGLVAQAAPAGPLRARAEAWPEADALFRRDPRWLGGDAALSVDLGDERTLWLFGDSFVAPPGSANDRAHAAFVRNAIAVQVGADPERATITFHWRTTATGTPSSYFPDDGDTWYWPGHGVRIGRTLTLFLHAMQKTGDGPFDFHPVGWRVVRIDDADGDPATWAPRPVTTPSTKEHGVVGAAVLATNDGVLAFGVREPGDHSVWLLRWTRDDFLAGELTRPAIWGGAERGFGPQPPATLFTDGATEFSVTRAPDAARWFVTQSRGFGPGTIALRSAPALEGPWTAPVDVFRPPDADRPGVFCYAGKAHASLRGADLVATYACNSTDPKALLADATLYYPRFVRITLTP